VETGAENLREIMNRNAKGKGNRITKKT